MKNLILAFFVFLLVSCREETKKITGDLSRITEIKVVYKDNQVEIRTYKLDGHDRILVRTARGVDDNHSENCKKCYEDPCN